MCRCSSSSTICDACWLATQDTLRRSIQVDGSGNISRNKIASLLSTLGMNGSTSIEQLIDMSGALSNDRVNLEKFIACLSRGFAPAPAPSTPSRECRLRIFHINDVYLLDNLATLKTCVEKLSEGLPRSNVLTTLAGDFLAPSLLSSIDHGHGMVDIMNSIPVDAVCFGNHESDVPHPSLLSRIRQYKGTWLNSNMRSFNEEEGKNLPPGALPDNHLIELEGGRSVALIGLCCGGGSNVSLYRDGAFNGHAARITPVLDAVDDAAARARAAYPNVDCVIPLTHQYMPDDLELSSRDFPVVLGGHDHSVFNETRNGTLFIKAGEDAYQVAVIDIVWATDAPPAPAPPTSVSVQLVQLVQPLQHEGPPMELQYTPDDAVLERIKNWQKPAVELQSAVLARLEPGKYSSVGVRQAESTMATLICTAMSDVVDCDGALINAGAVRGNKNYEDGEISYADLSSECPFPTAYVVVRLEGDYLSRAVAQSRQLWKEAGVVPDALHCDDQMRVNPETLAVMEVNGEPLIPHQTYDILMNSYLMQSNPVLQEYADKYPDRVPPEDSGQPALQILVQYFCDKVWKALVDVKGSGTITLCDIDQFFVEADTDFSGDISEDELLDILKKRASHLPGVARVVAKQCLSFADKNNDGKVDRSELIGFMHAEVKQHVQLGPSRYSRVHGSVLNCLNYGNDKFVNQLSSFGEDDSDASE